MLGVAAASSSETPHDEEMFVHSSERIYCKNCGYGVLDLSSSFNLTATLLLKPSPLVMKAMLNSPCCETAQISRRDRSLQLCA